MYHEYFKKEDNIELIEPDASEQEIIHDAIYNENYGIKAHSEKINVLAKNAVNYEIFNLIAQGAQAVILSCTELPLAVQKKHFPVPVLDPGLLASRRLIALLAPEKLKPI